MSETRGYDISYNVDMILHKTIFYICIKRTYIKRNRYPITAKQIIPLEIHVENFFNLLEKFIDPLKNF